MKKHLNSRGSIWRKWDLHLHAPGTALNDLYKGNWDGYLEVLANLEDISVLGITDYYGIEGYLKVKNAKKDGKLENIDLVIPNIEIRLDSATKDGNPINYHILFSPEVEGYIQSYFLNELEFNYDGKKYKCTKEDLIELGEVFLGESKSEVAKYKEGIMQFKIPLNDVINVLNKHESRFKGKYLLGLPNSSKDGGSGIRKAQFQGVKENIYKNSHVIFSGNPEDKKFFSYENELAMNLTGKLMPCIHGSDAHELKKIGNPDLNRFTWIKADPTFEGLLQIVHEPEYRVVVQEEHPDRKVDYNVIDKIEFTDEHDAFTTEPIYLNPDLNVIIGGKSSGKSALLFKIAQAISSEEIIKVSENWTNIYKDTFIEGANFKVTYNNGNVYEEKEGNGRVQYIPQMYINKISEDPNGDILQRKIKSILEENISDKERFLKTNERIEQIKQDTRIQVDLLIDEINLVLDTKKEVLGLPSEKEVQEEIKVIEDKINKAIEAAKLTNDETEIYEENIENLKLKNEELSKKQLTTEEHRLNIDKIKSTLTNTIVDIEEIKFENQEAKNILDTIVSTIKTSKDTALKELMKINYKYTNEKETLVNEINQLNKERSPIDEKLEQSNTISEDQKKLKEQREILGEIQKTKLSLNEAEENRRKTEERIFGFKSEQIEKLVEITDLIKSTEISNNLKADAKINFSNSKFDTNFLNLFQRRGKINNVLKNPDEMEIINDRDEFTYIQDTFIDDIKHLYNIILETSEEKLKLKTNSDKRDLLEALLKSTYIDVQYDLIKDNDSLYQMSPGNRGLVLLELFLHMSDELYPILIDQPEDNLDNRTISKELVKIIREQKNKRQIIIVTHNANLAVLTDAENIIVANQDHTLVYNAEKRFEYITGSLECSFVENNGEKFHDQGIKEHTSEILEGGEEAFEVRGRKYGYND